MPKSEKRKPMPWRDVVHFIAQGAINISEGEMRIETDSRIHHAMCDFCTYLSEGNAEAAIDFLKALAPKEEG